MIEQHVKRTASGGRIYEYKKVDDETRTDWSGLHINYGYTPYKPSLKERLVLFISKFGR